MTLCFYFRYNSAKRDNDFVYHEKVPELETLPEVKGKNCDHMLSLETF